MIPVKLKSEEGVGVNYTERAMHTIPHSHPIVDELRYPFAFFQFCTDNGKDDGSSDMVVDGSSGGIDFFISAPSYPDVKSPGYDVWITRFAVRISDPGANLKSFGALGPLPNGLEFFHFVTGRGRSVISEPATTNLELVRLAGGSPAFGTGTDAFLADISGGTGEDTYLPDLDMKKVFGLKWGHRLRYNTADKIGFRVRDNLAGIATFNIYGTGFSLDRERKVKNVE